MISLCNLTYSTAPQPDVSITPNSITPRFAGTALTLTCTATLHSNVDNGEMVTAEWTGPSSIHEERYTVSIVVDTNRIYIVSLTISSLIVQDNGIYTCTATIRGDSSSQHPSASDMISVDVLCKLSCNKNT